MRELTFRGPHVTARIAEACIAAAAARNATMGRPLRRAGISLGVGGPPGVGNLASYRRVDLGAEEPVHPAVMKALGRAELPAEIVFASRALRLLRPVSDRFSDTVLISNSGRHHVPGASRLELFPVARGRSAVAFGACGLEGGVSTLSIRARDLTQADAEALLDDAAGRLDPDTDQPNRGRIR